MEQKKQVRIVPMSPEHLDEIAALEKVCFSAPWSRNMLAEELDNACSAFLTALDETGRVVGYAGLQVILDEGYITNVAVRPEDRQKGVAAQLLQVFINFAKGNRLSFLTLEVRPSNTAAIVLYGHHGFRTAGRRKNYYELPREDALIMKLEFNYGTENGDASGTEGGL
ncbi:ribosomal protein S18-alanine N-acetyltransferase [Oscillibacter sp.]|uniref:ribosomal protein S18-alanine N-acetyltransferase n=1 Tax=Oscillibacter sp. TaxID=1945593 RepID=UPI0028962DAA|nr:ribosomal protein S18-alanine N-acetyltransferase [Oscillibacter sp.]